MYVTILVAKKAGSGISEKTNCWKQLWQISSSGDLKWENPPQIWMAPSSGRQDKRGFKKKTSLFTCLPSHLTASSSACHCCCCCCYCDRPKTSEPSFLRLPTWTGDMWLSRNRQVFSTRMGLLRYLTFYPEKLAGSQSLFCEDSHFWTTQTQTVSCKPI